MHDHDLIAVQSPPHHSGEKAANALSDAMVMVIACLGGRKRWQGRVRGLFGLLRRDVDIESSGALEDGVFLFRETLTFDNGDQEKREWRLHDTPHGVALKATGIEPLRPGGIEDGFLVFNYVLLLNGFKVNYRDAFRQGPDGTISNSGSGKVFGLPILTVEITGVSG